MDRPPDSTTSLTGFGKNTAAPVKINVKLYVTICPALALQIRCERRSSGLQDA